MKLSIASLVSPRNEYRILALMLVLVHLALWNDPEHALSRSLMLAHFGLFLLWQPLWNNEVRIRWNRAVVFLAAVVTVIVWLNSWLMVAWLLVLIAIVGARVTLGRIDRFAYLGALVFLISEILIGAVPVAFDLGQLSNYSLFASALLLLPLILYFTPALVEHSTESRVDFFYGLLISVLTALLALGGLFVTLYTQVTYVTALMQTVVALAVFLLVVSWLWTPLAGFGGLGQLWERYLLNIGTPFEQWLVNVSESAESGATPDEFLRAALKQLVDLPWVAGAHWQVGEQEQMLGSESAHSFRVAFGSLICTVFARIQVGPALLLHGRLLVELVGHFYEAKQREQQLAETAHLQAIFETGARVTHDIKNLLQSLHTLTVAVERGGDDTGALKLLSRQLPHITERLKLSLDKLQQPTTDLNTRIPVSKWWAQLCQRKEKEDIRFVANIDCDKSIPAELFDSVIDNLLDNTRIKRQLEPGIEVTVALETTQQQLTLRVTDTGSEVDPDVRARLFANPVPSKNGLGIGLYQAAKYAEQFGFTLSMRQSDGVCFELSRNYESETAPHPLRRKSDTVGPYGHLISKGPSERQQQ